MRKILLAIALASTTLLVSCSGSSSDSVTAPADSAAETTAKVAEASKDDIAAMDHSSMDGMEAQTSKDIHLVSPEADALPMGDAELVVHIAKDGLVAEDVSVEVAMPMEGEETMTAMAIVEPGEGEQEFKIKTNFGMAGAWTVHVMAPDAEPATLAFNIQ